MSTTAGAIIDGAWNRSANNDAGKLALDPELLAHLTRVYTRAWALVARARPDAFGSALTLTFAGIPPVVTLPADTIDVLHLATSAGETVALIPQGDRARLWQLAPCVFRRGQSLVSRNQGGDPQTGSALAVTLLDAPAALVSRASVLDTRWPSRHVQLLVDYLATYLGTKDAGRDAGDRAALAGELQLSAAAFASEFGLPPEAVEWLHAPVERAA